jgi:beta-lactamase superfamily II metal-dependent hydrolase
MQVPHHGANNSGHQRLMDLAYKYFICAGGSNQYQHPHKFVTDSLLKEMIDFQVVTERKYSELVYEIYPL